MSEPQTHEPPGSSIFAATRDPYGENRDKIRSGDRSAAEIANILRESEERVVALGQFSEHEVRAVFDVMYGPFKATGETRARRKEIQQETAAHLAFALSPRAPYNHTASLYLVAHTTDEIAQSRYGRGENLNTTWGDTKAQCGIITTLIGAGVRVAVPSNVPGSAESRIAAWSVLGRTDLVARTADNRVFLIQASGTRENDVLVSNQSWGLSELPRQLQAYLRALGISHKDYLPHLEITIPDAGSRTWEVPRDPIGEPKDYKSALRSLLTLKSDAQEAILGQILR